MKNTQEKEWSETAICLNCQDYENNTCTKRNKTVKPGQHCSLFNQTTDRTIQDYNPRPAMLKIDNYQDNTENFWNTQPFFYDKNKIFWFWNHHKHCYEITDETELMTLIDEQLGFLGQTISAGLRNNYIEAFRRVGRKHQPKEAPTRWIQFKKKVISLRTGKEYVAEPNYFFTNPIPWDIGESESTPIIDRLFTEWVGEENKEMLYEILSYCCYREYPIQVLFCFCGIGRNGKTQFLKLLTKFLGEHNICNTDLDFIAGRNRSRFETFKLYKKLAGIMGETDFDTMGGSSLLKRLTGGDMIGYEMKGKNPFDAYSYCKLLIASNSLPSSEDNTDGFYRRWIIIDWPNQFPEGKDIINSIPESEYCNLAKKIKRILPELLEKGSFTNQGSIEQRKKKFIIASNPISIFIKEYCIEGPNNWVRHNELYTVYCRYLDYLKKRIVSKKEFSKVLGLEGFECRRTSKNGEMDYYIEGLMISSNFSQIYPIYPISEDCNSIFCMGKTSCKFSVSGISGINEVILYIEKNDFFNNTNIIINKYGNDYIKTLVKQGLIFWHTPNWIKVLK